MDYVAVDVETANPDLASICQIGIAAFENGAVTETWETLVDPEDEFDPWNIEIHGITEADVEGAPTFAGLHAQLAERLSGRVIAHHTYFDRTAFARACDDCAAPRIGGRWLDTAAVVRRAWPEQFAQSGYGLKNVADALGITFRHHNALEDARAAGEILAAAIRDTGLTVADWLGRVKRPIDPQASAPIARLGNPEGPLCGEIVVFTGTLSMKRREAAHLASEAGCEVGQSVTQSTTLLVVGDQDIRKLAGHKKSRKRRDAEDLISLGQPIRVLTEGDFLRLIALDASEAEPPT